MSTRHARNVIASLSLGAALALTACTVGSTLPGDPNDPDNPDNPDNPGDVLRVSGDVTENATWSGQVQIVDEAIIKPGVTVEVAPGASIEIAAGVFLRAQGTLTLNGTADSMVSVTPTADEAFGGISAESGGSVTMTYATGENASVLLYCHAGAVTCVMDSVDFTNLNQIMKVETEATIVKSSFTDIGYGGLGISTGGTLNISDTYIFKASHDIVIMSGGHLIADHIEVGGTNPDSYEHCDFHIGAADSVRITNSNIISSVVGMMIGNVQDTVIQYNNFEDNSMVDIDDVAVGPHPVDLQYNYWKAYAPGAPVMEDAAFNVANPLAAPVADAGPRL